MSSKNSQIAGIYAGDANAALSENWNISQKTLMFFK